MPGFRPGKVPRRLLEVRLGPQAIRAEVIRHALPDYYAQAIEEADLDTIAAPEIDITSGEEDGPLAFDAVVEVRPKVSIAGYEGLVVTVPPLEASESEIDARIDRLREQFAELSEVERPARDGDLVTVDVHGVRNGQDCRGAERRRLRLRGRYRRHRERAPTRRFAVRRRATSSKSMPRAPRRSWLAAHPRQAGAGEGAARGER